MVPSVGGASFKNGLARLGLAWLGSSKGDWGGGGSQANEGRASITKPSFLRACVSSFLPCFLTYFLIFPSACLPAFLPSLPSFLPSFLIGFLPSSSFLVGRKVKL